MLVHIFIDLLCMSLSWHEIRYRTFNPAPSSVSGLQLLSEDGVVRQGQLVPAAGAAADSPDQKGLVGDIGQLRSYPGDWCRGGNRHGGKSPCPEPRTAPCRVIICYGHLVHKVLSQRLTNGQDYIVSWQPAAQGTLSELIMARIILWFTFCTRYSLTDWPVVRMSWLPAAHGTIS